MSDPRPAIPEAVKRHLRQEAGFGCCKCGLPIYQYQHIIPYSKEAHFRPEDMMLLCPNCHAEATLGALTEVEQRAYKSSPYNIKNGYAAGKLKMNQQICAMAMGSVQYVGDSCILQVDDTPLVRLGLSPEGRLELSVSLYDERDNLMALIEKNEWISGNTLPWDIEASFQFLRLRKKLGHISLDIDAKGEPLKIRADLWWKKQNIRLGPHGIQIDGVLGQVGIADLCLVGIQFCLDTGSKTLTWKLDPRYKAAKIISWPDPLERLMKGYAAWQTLERV